MAAPDPNEFVIPIATFRVCGNVGSNQIWRLVNGLLKSTHQTRPHVATQQYFTRCDPRYILARPS